MHTLRNRRSFVLFAFVLALVALAGAWLPQASHAAGSAFLAGNGNGNGNGGNGNGNGNGGNRPGGGLSMQLQPNVWNTNFATSGGTISAVIRGSNLGDVDLDSIVLVGTDAAEAAVEPLRVRRQGKQIRAFFAMDDAIDALDTPTRGEVHEVGIQLTRGEDDTEVTLTARVRIVGPAGGDDEGEEGEEELDLAVQPDRWNVNWSNSNGTVTALIRGEGLADIDLTSIKLVGTDTEAEPLSPVRARRQGNHIRAFFAKGDALATLDTPSPGEVHEIIIQLSADGEDKELKDNIRVVGPNR